MKTRISHEEVTSLASAGRFTDVLALLIVVESRRLSRFDAALVAYTFASLFAVFGIDYRYAMWLQRPPTALYWRRGWQAFFHRCDVARNLGTGRRVCAQSETLSACGGSGQQVASRRRGNVAVQVMQL
jgi:hypothetical protein